MSGVRFHPWLSHCLRVNHSIAPHCLFFSSPPVLFLTLSLCCPSHCLSLSLSLPHTDLLSIFLPSLFPLLLFPFLFSPQGYMSSHSLSLSLIPCFCSTLYYSHALALFLLSRSSLSGRTWFMALETSQKCRHGLIVGHAVC